MAKILMKPHGAIITGQIEIPLSRGRTAVVDAGTAPGVLAASWYCTKSGYAASYNYLKGTHVYLHKILVPSAGPVDHKDGNRLNNLKSNLRKCSVTENMRNQKLRKDSSSGFKGVSWRSDKKLYRSYITVGGKQLFLGYFNDIEVAARAYNHAALPHFGSFARLNNV